MKLITERSAEDETLEAKEAEPVEATEDMTPPRPGRCRSYARKRLAAALPKIASKFVKEAENGSSTHLKTLMQLGGLDGREAPKPVQRKGKGSAERLLEDWQKSSAGEGG